MAEDNIANYDKIHNLNKSLYSLLARISYCIPVNGSYLEIGTREGDSLAEVLTAVPNNISHVTLCDTWGHESGGTGRGSHEHILTRLNRISYKGEVNFLDGDSKSLIPKLDGQKFDLILVDGDHSEAGLRADLKNIWPLCFTGGIIVVDDLFHEAHPYIWQVVCDFIKEHRDEIIIAQQELGAYPGSIALWRTDGN